mmetsp:Transcript_24011/g.76637  ORF Transcript_24011/g.76637 Transcript_24011/m.76637 type:complete len:224 (+) Transcript_24011:1904-2575(+)
MERLCCAYLASAASAARKRAELDGCTTGHSGSGAMTRLAQLCQRLGPGTGSTPGPVAAAAGRSESVTVASGISAAVEVRLVPGGKHHSIALRPDVASARARRPSSSWSSRANSARAQRTSSMSARHGLSAHVKSLKDARYPPLGAAAKASGSTKSLALRGKTAHTRVRNASSAAAVMPVSSGSAASSACASSRNAVTAWSRSAGPARKSQARTSAAALDGASL